MKLDLRSEFTLQIAQRAGREILGYFGKECKVEKKTSEWDLVTEADKASEALIIAEINACFPEDAILAEESGSTDGSSEYLWVIDPLDGTTNFAHSVPFFAVSIALLHRDEIVLGVIYNPVSNEMFSAQKGGGAFLNGEKIAVSKVGSIQESLLATGFPYHHKRLTEKNFEGFAKLTKLSCGVRRFGSATLDLAYVASGRLDGYWEEGLSSWDVAAGALLVKEAGGTVTDLDGAPFDIYGKRILATNSSLHRDLLQELNVLSR